MKPISVLLACACVAGVAFAQDKPKAGDPAKPAVPAPAAKVVDRVNRTGGKPAVKGTIVSSNCVETVVKKETGGEERIPAAEVVSVDRGDAPEAFRKGVAAVGAGDYANAVQLLTLALEKGADRPWIKEAVGFHLGEAHRGLGKPDEASAAYESAIAAKPDTRFLAKARLGQAEAFAAAGRYPDAEKALNTFVSESEAKKVPRRYVLLAREAQGRNLEAQNRFGEAVGVYDAVVREAQGVLKDDPTVAERIRAAQRAKGSCLVREKKLDDAARVFDALAAEKGPEAEAMALTGKAEVLHAQGQFDAARAVLAKVVGARFDLDSETARAKLLMAKCLTELGRAGEKNASKAAQFYLNDLIQSDAATEYAKEARTLLSKGAR